MDLGEVRQGFIAIGIPANLTDELIDSYIEAKRRFHLRDLRPEEVEGGRFSEAVFRILQQRSGLTPTPLGATLPKVPQLLNLLEGSVGQPDSVRLHIPRTLRLIYDIRNSRDAAHLADNIDPNLQDATLVVNNMDWVVAELVRLYHKVTADEAQAIVEELVTKEVPAIQEIHGQPVILKDLQPRDQALLMLYRAGAKGASLDEIAAKLRVDRKDNLNTRLRKLDDERLVLFHPRLRRFYITEKGMKDVEQRKLAQPA